MNTIVIDLDETLCFHQNRDYANAAPNVPVINKLVELRAQGWKIIVHTARGMHSCAGDLTLIEQRNRMVTEDWLSRNGVPYDELQFGKPLAMLYVDDKAMRPDEFAAMNVQTFIGRSGATVQQLGREVVKTCSTAKQQFTWLKKAQALGYAVPHTHSLLPGSFIMEHIEGSQDILALVTSDLITLAQSFKVHPHPRYPFRTYFDYALRHYSDSADQVWSLFTVDEVAQLDQEGSFCHGDMTLSNMILRQGTIVLIDPSYKEGIWQSHLIDIGRLAQSALLHWETRYLQGREATAKEQAAYEHLRQALFSAYPASMVLKQLLLICFRVLSHLSSMEQELMKKDIENIMKELTC